VSVQVLQTGLGSFLVMNAAEIPVFLDSEFQASTHRNIPGFGIRVLSLKSARCLLLISKLLTINKLRLDVVEARLLAPSMRSLILSVVGSEQR
jgi:hypothetical protein